MFRKVIVFLLFLPSLLVASIDAFFDDRDPIIVHHVNVISGHFNLYFEDANLKSAVPFALGRAFTSEGALERTKKNHDLKKKKERGTEWMLQGGWTFLPHANLHIKIIDVPPPSSGHLFPTSTEKVKYEHYATVREKSGRQLTFFGTTTDKDKAKLYVQREVNSTVINPRKDPKNAKIKIKGKRAILYLPDRAERHYIGDHHAGWKILTKEVLPSGHEIRYHYTNEKPRQLESIEVKSPDGRKTLSSAAFSHHLFEKERKLTAETSDGVSLVYEMTPEIKERTYLHKVKSNVAPLHTMWYEPGRKGTGGRFRSFDMGSEKQLLVSYNKPRSREEEREWAKKPGKIPHWADKISKIEFPDPKTGDLLVFATFSYHEKETHVRDFEGLLTIYHHDKDNLTKIENFDETGAKFSTVLFEYEKERLVAKRLCDAREKPLLSRTFSYNKEGSLVEEKMIDHISGGPPVCRRYTYYPKTYLKKTEEQVGGLTYEYTYKGKTDLITSKLTKYQGKILRREITFYSEDNLAIKTILDDGTSWDIGNLQDISERHIEELRRHPINGLVEQVTRKVFDPDSQTEIVVSIHEYTYSKNRDLIKEEITFADETSYVYEFAYNEQGNLVEKKSPTGRVKRCSFDALGRLVRSKEVGEGEKHFTFDHLHRPTHCKEFKKTTQNEFDRKGRLLEEVDHLGNPISQTYDGFGRSIETRYPKALDADGNAYIPAVQSTYDLMGNLTSYTNPRGETTSTTYNAERKPIKIVHPDGGETHHTYNQAGSVISTTHPDSTLVTYEYDPFQRMTQKAVYSPDEELLAVEKWEYSTFHLLSYTDQNELTTKYEYNSHGQKIKEIAEDRVTTFAYNAQGLIERTTMEGYSQVQEYNEEGEVVLQWEEGDGGKKENEMRFFYDEEGRKTKAVRTTSKGEAEDQFFYDEEGRLILHIDPLLNTTETVYKIITNSLGQKVEQKRVIDPIGLCTIETFDANGRPVSIEKLDEEQFTVHKEEILYDRAGNRAKRVTTIFKDHREVRTHTITFEHDERGHLLKEIEEGYKETSYTYDLMGRLISKTLPSKARIDYAYDALGRLLETRSSDGALHYTYIYDRGPEPIEATDHVRSLTWKRTYNTFGELISEERPNGSTLDWTYDSRGRCTSLTLPDQSSIEYTYRQLHLHNVTRISPSGEHLYEHTYEEFDENGHVASEQLIYGLGTVKTEHDLLERAETIETPWHSSSLTYGPSGLITSCENSFFKTKDFEYDSLNQLIKEGERLHSFDSLGNPANAYVNKFNQIISLENTRFTYDLNGNPERELSSERSTTYQYDPFNRLTKITKPSKNTIEYTYDPFDRLYSKTNSSDQATQYYLYDKNTEIGSTDAESNLLQLKVVGLGILGEIGGAVAIELQGEHYLPVHDFCGNMILLISSDGIFKELIDIDAFGKNLIGTSSINPWRFSSKRSEEHLIFYGKRFYSPFLGRFLTPDPAGTLESPNLYLFVRNSPLNRLDLFGLFSSNVSINVSIDQIRKGRRWYPATMKVNEQEVDIYVRSGHIYEIEYTPEEQSSGFVNILNHFDLLTANEGTQIGLSTYQNGVWNEMQDFKDNIFGMARDIPEDVLIIGLFKPTDGYVTDIVRTADERIGKDTADTVFYRQVMVAIGEALYKVNKNQKWLHIPHSRAGAMGSTQVQGMTPEQQEIIKNSMIWVGIAPARPMPVGHAYRVVNYYSEADLITGHFGKEYYKRDQRGVNGEGHNIQFLEPHSSGITKGFKEHAFLSETYNKARKKSIDYYRGEFGFYEGR